MKIAQLVTSSHFLLLSYQIRNCNFFNVKGWTFSSSMLWIVEKTLCLLCYLHIKANGKSRNLMEKIGKRSSKGRTQRIKLRDHQFSSATLWELSSWPKVCLRQLRRLPVSRTVFWVWAPSKQLMSFKFGFKLSLLILLCSLWSLWVNHRTVADHAVPGVQSHPVGRGTSPLAGVQDLKQHRHCLFAWIQNCQAKHQCRYQISLQFWTQMFVTLQTWRMGVWHTVWWCLCRCVSCGETFSETTACYPIHQAVAGDLGMLP